MNLGTMYDVIFLSSFYVFSLLCNLSYVRDRKKRLQYPGKRNTSVECIFLGGKILRIKLLQQEHFYLQLSLLRELPINFLLLTFPHIHNLS